MADLLTLSEMAAELELSTKTFRQQVREQSVPFIRAGKRMKFDKYEVRAYLRDAEQVEKSNVHFVAFKKGKHKATSKRFAEAL